jgi:hypothetical protein
MQKFFRKSSENLHGISKLAALAGNTFEPLFAATKIHR